MNLKSKKELAGKVGNCSPKRVVLNPERLEDISKAITKADIRALINDNAIIIKNKRGVSRGRARLHNIQKTKGRRAGHGSRRGTANARSSEKLEWMRKIRVQRRFLSELKENEIIDRAGYRSLYLKAKGGFFRSKNHIKIYINERNLALKKPAK